MNTTDKGPPRSTEEGRNSPRIGDFWETDLLDPRDRYLGGATRLLTRVGGGPSLESQPFMFPPPPDDFNLLQELADVFSGEVAILDRAGRIIIVNRAWRSMAETTALPDLGDDCNAIALLVENRRTSPPFADQLRRVLSGEQAEARGRFSLPINQGLRHYQIRALPLMRAKAGKAILVNQDVSVVRALRREKRVLSKQLVKSEEQERQRIAREMHDSTVQDLVAIGLNLRRLGHLAGDALVDEVFSEIREILQRTQRDVRTMSYLLHPPLLEEGGLALALGSLIRGLSQRMNIRIHFETNLDCVRFPADAEMALYRVVQEALINVHRHACASRVVVRYRRAGKRLMVEVDDDGIGFDGADLCNVSLGVGVAGMRARLRQLGGALAISRLDQGTRLKATVPIGAARPRKAASGSARGKRQGVSAG